MKSKFFFAFALVAVFAAVLVSGCSKDSTTTTTTNNCIDINNDRDTGQHKIYLGVTAGNPTGIAAPLDPIRDTLDATVSGSNVTIHTMALQRNLTGHIDASDCSKVILDSVIFGTSGLPEDTLTINSAALGTVKIWNIRAGGSGTLNSTGVTTSIKIAKGNTNISAPIDLRSLTGLGLELRGTFLTLP